MSKHGQRATHGALELLNRACYQTVVPSPCIGQKARRQPASPNQEDLPLLRSLLSHYRKNVGPFFTGVNNRACFGRYAKDCLWVRMDLRGQSKSQMSWLMGVYLDGDRKRFDECYPGRIVTSKDADRTSDAHLFFGNPERAEVGVFPYGSNFSKSGVPTAIGKGSLFEIFTEGMRDIRPVGRTLIVGPGLGDIAIALRGTADGGHLDIVDKDDKTCAALSRDLTESHGFQEIGPGQFLHEKRGITAQVHCMDVCDFSRIFSGRPYERMMFANSLEYAAYQNRTTPAQLLKEWVANSRLVYGGDVWLLCNVEPAYAYEEHQFIGIPLHGTENYFQSSGLTAVSVGTLASSQESGTSTVLYDPGTMEEEWLYQLLAPAKHGGQLVNFIHFKKN